MMLWDCLVVSGPGKPAAMIKQRKLLQSSRILKKNNLGLVMEQDQATQSGIKCNADAVASQ